MIEMHREGHSSPHRDTSTVSSLSSRPLRQLPTRVKSAPQYGRVSRTSNYSHANHRVGNSLPLSSSSSSSLIDTRRLSSSLDHKPRGSTRKASSFRHIDDSPPRARQHANSNSSTRGLRNASPDLSLRSSKKKEPPYAREEVESESISSQDPPFTKDPAVKSLPLFPVAPPASSFINDGPEDSVLSAAMDKTIIGSEIEDDSLLTTAPRKEVHFNSVFVHYYEEDGKNPLLQQIDVYERERGPTRPPKSFMKSEAELRDVRRMQVIADAEADEEWREIQEEIQEITALAQSSSGTPHNNNGASTDDSGSVDNFKESSKTKKRGFLRKLFKRKSKSHPLADI